MVSNLVLYKLGIPRCAVFIFKLNISSQNDESAKFFEYVGLIPLKFCPEYAANIEHMVIDHWNNLHVFPRNCGYFFTVKHSA